MASRASVEHQAKPEPGQVLIVIHNFSARGSDELSLSKGDRVELIERDDDFGDGWYLGRHLMNGSIGLFPEVYTRIAPRGTLAYPLTSPMLETSKSPPVQPISNSAEEGESPTIPESMLSATTAPFDSAQLKLVSPTQEAGICAPVPAISSPEIVHPKSITMAVKVHSQGQESPVMHETLSVIDKHITGMHCPPNDSVCGADRRVLNDSGSEYSSHLDQRLSYINGEETDEEEEGLHTREDVSRWTPDQVASYLFASGVEPKHCEVFKDQEITGDVLLGMDQTSVFLKEFDLGSVGRRLKTWQKIKVLQDEIREDASTRRNTPTYGSELGLEDVGRHKRHSTASPTMLPRIPSINEKQDSFQSSRGALSQNSSQSYVMQVPLSASPKRAQDRSRFVDEKTKPSASEIRDMRDSRHDSLAGSSTAPLTAAISGPPLPAQEGILIKRESFNRNWTMDNATSLPLANRVSSFSEMKTAKEIPHRSSTEQLSKTPPSPTKHDVLDRGYFSGGEIEGKPRNLLRKRGSTGPAPATHLRNSSYTEEKRLSSTTTNKRHSRFGSIGSIHDSAPPSAAAKYYGITGKSGWRNTPSETSDTRPQKPTPPKDILSPTVTKLDGGLFENSLTNRHGKVDFLASMKSASSRGFGFRAISDAVTGHERSRVISPIPDSIASPYLRDSPLNSPSRTDSSTPSGGPSLDLDSPNTKNTNSVSTNNVSTRSKKKTKKDTSAYTRGLEKRTPKVAMADADYSGWMKKKSTNLMASWKPRLFILKGRRLSYYYSEEDQEERGLIDISFHRVLPADNDLLTGLHATLTGATHSPTSPSGAQTTIAAAEAYAQADNIMEKGTDSMFIFKLVPPRAGLSRAVTFTKPTVHYFAVPNIKQGRLWMAALMKATIDRDDSVLAKSTYQQKTISLAKARAMRHRPPALMNLDEKVEEPPKTLENSRNPLQISGIIYDREPQEGDSGVSGVSGLSESNVQKRDSVIRGTYHNNAISDDVGYKPSSA